MWTTPRGRACGSVSAVTDTAPASSTDRRDLTGRAAIVTGATRGIGLGIARELVARGAQVCLTARKDNELERAVEELDPAGAGVVIAARGSADDAKHQQATIELVLEEFGRLDLLVNNAGINPAFGPLIDVDLGAIRKIYEVNVIAALAWAQHAWRAWMAEHGGAIVNVASVGGVVPAPFIGAYNTSKAALIHLTRQLASELGPGVRVNGIAPAVVKTDFAKALYEADEQGLADRYPLKRLGVPQDTASLTAFLLSDEASWVTGQTVVIDGGITSFGGF
jgi:NAD(P)-dependent dehydrogenase (short-subunit alcohol dehydrogenase family)